MNCPKCNGSTKVFESAGNGDSVYRGRKCINCDFIFYTQEVVEPAAKYIVANLRFTRRKINEHAKRTFKSENDASNGH